MYLSVKQVAALLAISEALVYGWVESGALACYRLGGTGRRGAIRVTETDLNAFLEKCRNQKERPGEKPAAPPSSTRRLPTFKHLRLK